MRLIIEGRLEDAQMGAAPVAATIVEGQDGSLANLELKLAEGRALCGYQQIASYLQLTMS